MGLAKASTLKRFAELLSKVNEYELHTQFARLEQGASFLQQACFVPWIICIRARARASQGGQPGACEEPASRHA